MVDEVERAHLFISGRVQGVTFRASTRRRAKKMDLNGWVKNLKDGRVEAVFEGPEGKIKEMVDWCHRGPRAARVENVEVEWEKPREMGSFEIKY